MTARLRIVLGFALVAISIAGRLLPHPPNFAPVAAAALFAGFIWERKAVAALVPMSAMLFSDAVIGGYDYRIMTTVYLALVMPVLWGHLLRRGSSWWVLGAAVSNATAFFLLTNFAVWLFSGMYPVTSEGLRRCYFAGLPFYKNTLAGDSFWTTVFFGSYALSTRFVRSRSGVPARSTCTEATA